MSRVVTLIVSDHAGPSDPCTTAIAVTEVNQPPVVICEASVGVEPSPPGR